MSFLSLILALLAERYLHLGRELRDFGWFAAYGERVLGLLGGQAWASGWAGLLVLIGLPALGVMLVLEFLQGRWFSLPALGFATLVLVWCLGPESLWASLAGYFEDRERDDVQGAYRRVANVVCAECAEDEAQLSREVTRWILCEAHGRWFAVLFWFVVLGPAGALAYRLMRVYGGQLPEGHGHREPLAQLQRLADWLPVRMTGFAYALSGDFVRAWAACRTHALAPVMGEICGNTLLLVEAGMGALGLDADREAAVLGENREALALVERSFIVLVVILSVLSVFGLMW
ncbi:MAG: regulatory signaling modulator protein AmpE [Gammaproteobacteria bacterium]|nr:regulatory signaling modulator protein AmpE [Gammaproteobacteria bacterium]